MKSGTRIGPYEITAALGAGGMGEVYRARDTRLNRDVALKVLPETLATDAERMARFEQEARSLASLNHPNIAQVYGLERGDATVIVMELVEGEDLAARLEQGPLPIDDILPIARQIAEALEAAHEAGIVHRDLKPANVRVRPDGTAKVLDFGLAKSTEGTGTASGSAADSPTIMSPAATGVGVIMGTAAYMAPEQARGKQVDRRADVWAFGCVLFELTSGQRAFRGDDVSMTLASVLKKDIDWEALPADTPAPLRRMIERCLEVDPRRRYQSIGDARVQIEDWIAEGFDVGFDAGLAVAGARGGGTASRIPWIAVGLAAGALIGALGLGLLRGNDAAPDEAVRRFSIPVASGADISDVVGGLVALTDDGSTLWYADLTQAPSRSWLRSMASLEPIEFPPQSVIALRFSPDGREAAMIILPGATPILLRASIEGDNVSMVQRGATGFDWREDGSLVFAREGALWLSDGPGDEATKLLDLADSDGSDLQDLDILPGDRVVLATRSVVDESLNRYGVPSIVAVSLETGETLAELAQNAISPRYAESGHLLFARGLAAPGEPEQAVTLMAAAFDIDSLRMTGNPVAVVSDLGSDPSLALAQYDIAADGTLVYVPFQPRLALGYTLTRVRANGTTEALVAEQARYMYRPRVSPDGRRVAIQVVTAENGLDIWVYDLERTGARLRLTDRGNDYDPVWSPDGRDIYYSSNRSDREDLYVRRADGGGDETLVIEEDLSVNAHSWHPDGVTLTYYARRMDVAMPHRDIGILHREDGGWRAEEFLATEANERSPIFSPDGRWLAYASDQSGRDEVYVTDYPDRSRIFTVSTGGGREPVWAPDGRALYYRLEDNFYRVPVSPGEELQLGTPELFASGAYVPEVDPLSGSLSYDVDNDGNLIVVRREGREGDPTQVLVTLNFFEELRRLAPGER